MISPCGRTYRAHPSDQPRHPPLTVCTLVPSDTLTLEFPRTGQTPLYSPGLTHATADQAPTHRTKSHAQQLEHHATTTTHQSPSRAPSHGADPGVHALREAGWMRGGTPVRWCTAAAAAAEPGTRGGTAADSSRQAGPGMIRRTDSKGRGQRQAVSRTGEVWVAQGAWLRSVEGGCGR